jgi:hypothetical protein
MKEAYAGTGTSTLQFIRLVIKFCCLGGVQICFGD